MYDQIEGIISKAKVKFLAVMLCAIIPPFLSAVILSHTFLMITTFIIMLYTVIKYRHYSLYQNFINNCEQQNYITVRVEAPNYIIGFEEVIIRKKKSTVQFSNRMYYKIFTRAILVECNKSKEIKVLTKNGKIHLLTIDAKDQDIIISYSDNKFHLN